MIRFACCFGAGITVGDRLWESGWEFQSRNPMHCPFDFYLVTLLQSSKSDDHQAVITLLENYPDEKSLRAYLRTSPMQQRLLELRRGSEPSASHAAKILEIVEGPVRHEVLVP